MHCDINCCFTYVCPSKSHSGLMLYVFDVKYIFYVYVSMSTYSNAEGNKFDLSVKKVKGKPKGHHLNKF